MKTNSLKSITTKIGSGATPTGGEKSYKCQGISLIRSQNVLDFQFSKDGLAFIDNEQADALNNVTVQKNDILLNITGDSIARCCIVPKDILPARVNQHVSIIRSDGTVNSNYLFYYLQFLKPYMLKICGVGGTRNALTKEAIEKFEINIHPTQTEIANILSCLDSKIQLNNRINTELETMAKTIYNYWFVQFDFPNENGKPYKTSGGEMEWNEELKREIPVGWTDGKLKSFFEIFSGYPFDSDSYLEEGNYKLITIKNVQDNLLDTNSTEFIGELPSNLPDYCKLKLGDLLISLTGNVGRVCIVTEENLLLNQRVGIAIPQNGFNSFAYFALQSEFILKSLKKIATGSNQKNLSPIEAVELQALIPQQKIIEQFEAMTKSMFEMIVKNQIQNQELIHLRDFLLPLLMNGQVKVREESKKNLSIAAEAKAKYGK